ncbi:signal peptidase II [Clostridium cadaveris]|uniref:signal peptidase II n=1 Tax=Clostridium cadaveris TaxID=1529 RepID=UPI000C075C8A|nr:signal peptidase II [Clostridium cadaveris]UFH63480.1 signal peptidase II [Clostridium cadaveris]
MEIVIIILGIILDRVTKLWALKILKPDNDIIIIKNYFQLAYLENRGAAFGIFQNKIVFLSLFTIILIIGLSVYLYKNRKKSKLLSVSLSLIISGALGNFYDRVVYKYVVDFICVHYKNTYYFPTFNVADVFVVCGTILLAIYILRMESDGEL